MQQCLQEAFSISDDDDDDDDDGDDGDDSDDSDSDDDDDANIVVPIVTRLVGNVIDDNCRHSKKA